MGTTRTKGRTGDTNSEKLIKAVCPQENVYEQVPFLSALKYETIASEDYVADVPIDGSFLHTLLVKWDAMLKSQRREIHRFTLIAIK